MWCDLLKHHMWDVSRRFILQLEEGNPHKCSKSCGSRAFVAVQSLGFSFRGRIEGLFILYFTAILVYSESVVDILNCCGFSLTYRDVDSTHRGEWSSFIALKRYYYSNLALSKLRRQLEYVSFKLTTMFRLIFDSCWLWWEMVSSYWDFFW